jgi:putative membrane protein
MSRLFARSYTVTYCVIFGIFLAMIPNMLTESCVLGWDGQSILALILMALGFGLSFWLGDLENNNRRLRRLFGKREK